MDKLHRDVLDAFLAREAATPDAPLYTFVGADGRDGPRLTYRELRSSADALAGFLADVGLRRGDRVLLVYTPSLEFVKALVGCLRAGIVAVPVCPPDPRHLEHDLERFSAMAESSGARAILTNAEYARLRLVSRVRGLFRRGRAAWPELPWHTTDGVKPGAYVAPLRVATSPNDPAILQYTSGSTSRPRGVTITHGNLTHQLTMNRRETGLGPNARAVLWVPHFHDFGLVTGILSALAGNGRLWLMSPMTFVQRPAVWLDVMSRVRATHTAAPNFAYDLAVRKTTAEERRRWDLRSLEVVMSAAEPVRHATVRAFLDAFAVSGLRPEAFFPSYGLAENTVGVTLGGRATLRAGRAALQGDGVLAEAVGSEPAAMLVGCGKPADGVTVRIVDPETHAPLPDGTVGEIWVDSPSKAAGYFGLPEETRRTFHARLAGVDDPTEYLRTGDLGALHGGELFITGRLKDLVIIRGRNFHPHDLEDSVRDRHAAIRPGGVAAFSIENDARGEEELVVAAEIRDGSLGAATARDVAEAIRGAILEDHGQPCAAVCLVKPGSIPKTTSGKLRRHACREAWASGEMERAPSTLAVVRFAVPTAAGEDASQPDPRLLVDDDFRRVVDDLGAFFARMTRARGGRSFHKEATTLRGTLEVPERPDLPPHRIFAPGRRYPVLVRHANGIVDDDAAPDNRGATVRVLHAEDGATVDRPLLDLLLTTGRTFLARSALEFQRWMKATDAEREAIVRERPEIGAAAWEMFRAPASYAELHYHAKTANLFNAEDGRRFLARFRLVPADGRADTGFVDPSGALLPPSRPVRARSDARSRSFLHEDLRERIAGGGIDYLLQVQLRPTHGSAESIEDALDCTRPWPEDAFPFRTCARMHLDTVEDGAAIEPLAFNPWNAPPELALPLARSPRESASLAHVRSLVYEMATEARRAQTPAPAQAPAPAEPASRVRRRVCVVGAGAAGLAAAWELERLGHDVTVLEREAKVAGKCASVAIDGRAYDLGGHVCSDRYTALREMVEALGVATEASTPVRVYDLDRRAVDPPPEGPTMREQLLRYQRQRDAAFRGILAPGLHGAATSLWQPIGPWFDFHDLGALGEALATTFTASGYGFVDERSTSAAYILKAAELAGILAPPADPRVERYWTPADGFGAFWERVARSLSDVRTSVSVASIERRDGEVRVRAGGEDLVFDALVLATPLDEAPRFLDASEEERDLFGRIRIEDYFTLVCRTRGLPGEGFYLVKQSCASSKRRGHAVAFHRRYDDSDVTLFYAYGAPGLEEHDVRQRVAEDVERMGGRLDDVLSVHRWRYFPHVSPEDVRAGYFDRIESLQGRHATWYVGSLLGFELVEGCVAHARDLVRRHFEAPERPASARDARSPDAILAQLRSWLERALPEGGPAFNPDEDLTRYGLDSIRSVELLQRLGSETGLALDPVTLIEHPTPRALAAHIAALLAAPSEPRRVVERPKEPRAAEGRWFFRPEPQERPRLRLFCFHHAGGHVSRFETWPRGLPPGVEVCAVQLPGRSPRDDEPSIDDIAELLPAIEEAMLPLLDVPFALFGHSAGALLAYELCHHLRERGRPQPIKLFVSSIEPPEMLAITLTPWARADLQLVSSYRYENDAPLDVPIHAIGGEGDLLAPAAALAAWAGETRASFEGTILDGYSRFDTAKPPFLEALAASLRAAVPGSSAVPESPRGPVRAGAWLSRLSPLERPLLRLFCFHDDGGTEAMFDHLAGQLPPGIEVCPVLLPARGARIAEPPITDFATLVAAIAEGIEPWLGVPFAFYGHSGGAIVAFEVARRLRRRRLPSPARLIVSSAACPAFYAMTLIPAMRGELTLASSWEYRERPPLPIPIAAFGGVDDPMYARAVLDAWREHTNAGFSLAMLPGGHFHVQTGEARFLEALAAELPIPRADPEACLAALAEELRRAPHASSGPFDLYERCWAARATADAQGAAPLFPEVLASLLAAQNEDGGLGPRSHPHANVVLALAFANTLAQYDTASGSRYETAIRRAVRHAVSEVRRSKAPRVEAPYGRYHRTEIVWGRTVLSGCEAERLLQHGRRYLVDDEAEVVGSLVGAAQQRLRERDHDALFATDSLSLHFAEHFPADALRTPAARAHVARAEPLPGFTVAFSARYHQETRDPRVRELLAAALDGRGLWLGGRRMVLVFALRFLMEGGVDVARRFPTEVAEVARMLTAHGMTVEARGEVFDCDLTAMALALCHQLGLPSPMPTRALETWWSEAHGSYQAFDGSYVPIVSQALHVLEAWLVAPDVSREEQTVVWRRTVRLLEEQPWLELYHYSPFYVWEHVVALVARHEHRFPEHPTRVHHEALRLVLEEQHPSGGFGSAWAGRPNREETALALLALRAAMDTKMAADRAGEVERAARHAEAFLADRADAADADPPALWPAKLPIAPLTLIEAIVAASLHRTGARP